LDRHSYLDEMRHAYERLAVLIEQIAEPKPNVVALGHSHVAVR
jgi:hypothetical protein